MLISYLIILVTLFFSAFFSGSEIAFISANRLKIELKKEQGSLAGRIIADFYERPSKFIGTMLIGNNIALVVFGMMTENLWKEPLRSVLPTWLSGEFGVLLTLTILTTIIVLFAGEFIPKTVFRLFAERILLLSARFLRIIYALLFPVVWFTVQLSEGLLRLFFKTPPQVETPAFSRLDLEHFVMEVSEKTEENIDPQLFNKALQLREITVQNCLIPLEQVESVERNTSLAVLRAKFIESQYSRLLIYETSPENITAYVHVQNIYRNPASISEISKPIQSVESDDDGYEVLHRFMKDKINIACVRDPVSQKIVGIITLEDVLEELFGEIDDEYD